MYPNRGSTILLQRCTFFSRTKVYLDVPSYKCLMWYLSCAHINLQAFRKVCGHNKLIALGAHLAWILLQFIYILYLALDTNFVPRPIRRCLIMRISDASTIIQTPWQPVGLCFPRLEFFGMRSNAFSFQGKNCEGYALAPPQSCGFHSLLYHIWYLILILFLIPFVAVCWRCISWWDWECNNLDPMGSCELVGVVDQCLTLDWGCSSVSSTSEHLSISESCDFAYKCLIRICQRSIFFSAYNWYKSLSASFSKNPCLISNQQLIASCLGSFRYLFPIIVSVGFTRWRVTSVSSPFQANLLGLGC